MNPTLKAMLELCEMGLAIHWLLPKSKAPVNNGWAAAPVASIATLEATYRPGYNIGFRPGKWSVVEGHEIVVLDIDIRGGLQYANEAYQTADTILGGKFDPHVMTGSGVGRHQYLRVPIGESPAKANTTLRQSDIWIRDGQVCISGTKEAKPAFLIELLSTGKNVALPPSIHPDTGKPYEFLKEFSL
ncbi:MAG: bifunctional DNA primase/polymerase [Rhodocyclales bacterium]|nr:bifunctional DNA primase/polymerase [Rhodocyclales bacterium]